MECKIRVICLVLFVECLINVGGGECKVQQDSSNFTSVDDRKDVEWKKPPRKRGTFSFGYGTGLGYVYTGAGLKSFPFPKKEHISSPVEKYVAVPVHIKVPIHVPKPYPVTIEKPVPVPIKVNVPQPYPVYKKVPVDRPVPVQILKPYPVYVEKQVPYPVDKPVPVPVQIPVDRPYPVYVQVERSTEKSTVTNMLQQLKWQPESGKMMSWFQKPDMSPTSIKMSADDMENNEKLVSSFFEIPEQSAEADIAWPAENMELEIRK